MERIDEDGFTHLTPTRKGAKKLQEIEARQQQKKNGSKSMLDALMYRENPLVVRVPFWRGKRGKFPRFPPFYALTRR